MNSIIEKQLKKLDVNGDGKIDVTDAHVLINAELAKRDPLRVGLVCFIAGIVLTLLVVYIAR